MWGYKIINDKYVPLSLSAASTELLVVIHCGCKGVCKTTQCTCFKTGIDCGPGRDNCTENCENKNQDND